MGTEKNNFPSKNLWALASNQVLSMSTGWVKVFTSLASPPLHTTISAILSHSLYIHFLEMYRTLAVEDITKLINPWHFNISRFVKFWKDTEGVLNFSIFDIVTERFSRLWKIGLGFVSSFHKCFNNNIYIYIYIYGWHMRTSLRLITRHKTYYTTVFIVNQTPMGNWPHPLEPIIG